MNLRSILLFKNVRHPLSRSKINFYNRCLIRIVYKRLLPAFYSKKETEKGN